MFFSCVEIKKEKLNLIHEAALKLLSENGLRIDCKDYHAPLKLKGAKVSHDNTVKFPSSLVEETIENIRNEIANGYRQNILNGVVSGSSSSQLQVKFGGACIEFLDWEKKKLGEPSYDNLVDTLRLGEALDEVATVGNPVVCLNYRDGRKVAPYMQRVFTAATVAKYTSKCGSTEVWNEKELDILIEIGKVVHGSEENFIDKPCFITAKETISPFIFPEEDGRILLMLAERGLPCTIVPMPLAGMSSPVNIASNAAMAVAEVLGVMTALKNLVPDAKVAGGVISGVMDMRSTTARFAVPGALMQDILAFQVFKKLYGQNFGIGSGYIDAKIPGAQSLFEKYSRMLGAMCIESYNFSVGILNSGKRFCMEEALMEIECARHLERFSRGFEINENELLTDLMIRLGTGGNFIAEEETALNFKEHFFMPELLGGREFGTLDEELENDMVHLACEKKKKILSEVPYVKDEEKAKAINEIVKKAEQLLEAV